MDIDHPIELVQEMLKLMVGRKAFGLRLHIMLEPGVRKPEQVKDMTDIHIV